jgi:hypothetical protein
MLKLCLGKQILLISERVRTFSSPSDLSRRFRRKQLSNLNEEIVSMLIIVIVLSPRLLRQQLSVVESHSVS